jgi:hypothetical protein
MIGKPMIGKSRLKSCGSVLRRRSRPAAMNCNSGARGAPSRCAQSDAGDRCALHCFRAGEVGGIRRLETCAGGIDLLSNGRVSGMGSIAHRPRYPAGLANACPCGAIVVALSQRRSPGNAVITGLQAIIHSGPTIQEGPDRMGACRGGSEAYSSGCQSKHQGRQNINRQTAHGRLLLAGNGRARWQRRLRPNGSLDEEGEIELRRAGPVTTSAGMACGCGVAQHDHRERLPCMVAA